MLLLGLALVCLALGGAWSLGRAPAAEPSPMDVLAGDEAAAGVHWDLPVAWNGRVEHWVNFLAGENHDRTKVWLERSGRYEPMIRQELRRRGMPQDLVYLAFIESGFSPDAYSKAHAAGLWQFVAETGRILGLTVNPYVDERRDPLAATDAALDFLSDLHDEFGSWYLAAAAYNTGPNRVERVLREVTGKTRGDDSTFWRIAPYLPRETRNYVPLMLAAGHIAKQPARYGFTDLDYRDPLEYDEVTVPPETPLAVVARAAGVADSLVDGLNPQLVQDRTPPDRSWKVRVPVGARTAFRANFPRVSQEARLAAATARLRAGASSPQAKTQVASASGSRQYRVRRGDTLNEIAHRYDVSVTELKRWNRLRGSVIQPGQRLRLGD